MTKRLAEKINWRKVQDLVPVIVQDFQSRDVLMMGYMNREALALTLKTGKVTFWSRTRQRLWEKGETSGDTLHLKGIRLDCDHDTLLIEASAAGNTCHLGTKTCFGDAKEGVGWLPVLQGIIRERKRQKDPKSYTWSLLKNGPERAAKKLGEEGVELALASVAGDKPAVREEAADVLYHLLVLLEANEVPLTEVVRTLESRHDGKS